MSSSGLALKITHMCKKYDTYSLRLLVVIGNKLEVREMAQICQNFCLERCYTTRMTAVWYLKSSKKIVRPLSWP
jgi:hypothetical protein